MNTDERQILGGVITLFFGFALLIWLVSTNTPPRVDNATTDPQTFKKTSYELNASYNKYMNHVYNDKNQ